MTGRLRVLVTGAAGAIGSVFATMAHEDLELILTDRDGPALRAVEAYGRTETAELEDLPRLKKLCEGVDAVVHLGANPSPDATWAELLPANIVGTYHLFAAARSAGVSRVVYASSIHAVSSYGVDVQVRTADPVLPGSLYGVTKCFGEALGAYMAEHEGMEVVSVRIGACQSREAAAQPGGEWMERAFLSYEDAARLLLRAVTAPGLRHAIVHGVSRNAPRLDMRDTVALLGFEPQDDFGSLSAGVERDPGHVPPEYSLRDPGARSGLREDIAPL